MNYVDGVTDTPFHDASNPIIITEYSYTSTRMGNVSLTATLMYPECLDDEWDGRQYVEFHGEKYFVNGTPSSSKDNEDTRYRHNLTFMAERDIKLNNVYFYDAVSDASTGDDKYKSNSTKVTFFGTINEFAARLGESLKYSGIDYTVVVDNDITSEPKLMSFEDQFFFNVLQEIYNVYNVPFYFEGKIIHIGFAANAITHPFKYGIENELLSINKNNSNFRIINRCSGTGSEDNIPYYYPNLSPKGDISAKAGDTNTGVTQQDIAIVDKKLFSQKMDFVTPLIYKGGIAMSSAVFAADVVDPPKFTPTRPVNTEETNAIQNTSNNARYSRNPTAKEYETIGPDGIQVDFGLKSDQWVKNIYLKITSTATEAGRDTSFALSIGYKWLGGTNYSNIKTETTINSGETPENCTIKDSGKGDNTFIVRADKTGTITFYLMVRMSLYNLIYSGDVVSYTSRFNLTFSAKWSESAGWECNDEPIDSLSDYGLSIGDTVPRYGDEIYMNLDRYVTPSQKLLPSIYRKTYGAERFYNALNETYTNPESGKFYVFENEYIPNAPKEHIEDFPDIKPTITGITNIAGQNFDTILDVAFDADDNDDVDDEGKYLHPYFFVKLPKFDGEYGFNLFDSQIDEAEMSLSLTSGNCGACEFVIGVSDDDRQANLVQVDSSGNLMRDENGNVRCGREGMPEESPQERQNDTVNNEVWIALKKEESTYGQIMPNATQNLKVVQGDTFVILHIDMPLSYVLAAEKRLEDAIIKYMADNNSEKFDFSIKFSRIFLAENPEIAEQLNENASIQIEYNGKLAELYITQYTYKCEDDEALPEVQVELNDTITVTKTVLQNTVDAITMDVQNGIANIDFLTQGLRYFLRKDVNDESKGIPRFANGAEFGKYSPGILGTGGALSVDSNNVSRLEVDYLSVRRRADFTQISVQELRSIGGQLIISPAAMVCSAVDETEDAYRCYFDTDGEDGQPATYNQFVVGDQARMQHFNQLQIAYYWRLVIGVGENYIDLSKTDCDSGSDIPMAGDNIVQLGNRNDTTRQSAQILSCYGDDAPSFVMYNGINSYNLTEKNIVGITYNSENKEPQLYCYGPMFFGDRDMNDPDATYITFQQREGEDRKKLFIQADISIGKGSSGLENLSEWSGKQQQIDAAVEKAQQTATDIQYLKDTFRYVTDVDGVVISKLVAVKDVENKIKAFLNGSNLGEDDTHGKILLAGGISDIDNPQTATTRIYEDGHIVAKSAEIEGTIKATDGSFGPLFIETYMGDVEVSASYPNPTDPDGYNYNMSLSAEHFSLYAWRSTNNDGESLDISPLTNPDKYDTEAILQIRGYSTDLANNRSLIYLDQTYKPFAITCDSGMFAGLRPAVNVVSTLTGNTLYLTERDHTIIITLDKEIDIQLPSNPKQGQEYLIIKTSSAKDTLKVSPSPANSILYSLYSGATDTELQLTSDRYFIHIVYVKTESETLGRWYVSLIRQW